MPFEHKDNNIERENVQFYSTVTMDRETHVVIEATWLLPGIYCIVTRFHTKDSILLRQSSKDRPCKWICLPFVENNSTCASRLNTICRLCVCYMLFTFCKEKKITTIKHIQRQEHENEYPVNANWTSSCALVLLFCCTIININMKNVRQNTAKWERMAKEFDKCIISCTRRKNIISYWARDYEKFPFKAKLLLLFVYFI